MVTKKEVDKAEAEWVAAVVAAKGLVDVELTTAASAAWFKYRKLKREYENGKG